MIAPVSVNDAPNDRLQPDLQSVVVPVSVDFSWLKPREQDFASRDLGWPLRKHRLCGQQREEGGHGESESRRY